MKHLLIALIALTITLGVGCKKEKVVEPIKKELSIKKLATDEPGTTELGTELVREHSAACKRGDRGAPGYVCPGPDTCNPPK